MYMTDALRRQAEAMRTNAGAHFERDTREGVEAKMIRFTAVKYGPLLADQAWAVACQRYGMKPKAGRAWRLVSCSVDENA